LESLVVNYDQYITTPIHLLQWTFYPSQFLPEIPQAPTNILSPLAEFSFRAFEIVTTNSIWVLFILMTVFYLMMDGHRLTGWLILIVPEGLRPDVKHLFAQLRHVWDDYMRSQLAFMFIVGLVDSLVWLAVGLPGAILLGFLTGLTSFVHEVGAIVSGVFSIGVALLIGSHFLPLSNFWFAIVVLILYLILTGVKNFWIRPVIVGRHVHLHSGVVFVIIISALIFHGALAAFVAVPVFVSLLVIGRYLRRRILGLLPFTEGEDPSAYFSLRPQPESETPAEE
jgi:predicted PurR-regulated permease PerM